MSNTADIKLMDSAAHAPEAILKLATKMLERHDCPGYVSRETGGYHLYMPCPDCLHTHGHRELDDPKYSINLSMIAGLGEYAGSSKHSFLLADLEDERELAKTKNFRSSVCMRTRSSRNPHRFSWEDLLRMDTVSNRHSDIHTKVMLSGGAGSAEREEMWEEDPISGGNCPPPAGDQIPLDSLPPEHPAVAYLTNRGFDISNIAKMFRLSFCIKEYPYGQKKIFYRKMPGRWKDSPQHRIIFHSLVDNIPMTWQARVIEKVSDDELNRYMLHPYAGGFYPDSNLPKSLKAVKDDLYTGTPEATWDPGRNGYWIHMWSHTHTRANPKSAWIPVPPFNETNENGTLRFQPSKYRTAKYSSRNMMGWDAAIERAANDPSDTKWCVLMEGPLDGARAGPGGIPLIGSSLSLENAAKIVSNFHVVFTAFDADKAGRDATEKIGRILNQVECRVPLMTLVMPIPITAGMDVGDMKPEEYQTLFNRILKRSKRQM